MTPYNALWYVLNGGNVQSPLPLSKLSVPYLGINYFRARLKQTIKAHLNQVDYLICLINQIRVMYVCNAISQFYLKHVDEAMDASFVAPFTKFCNVFYYPPKPQGYIEVAKYIMLNYLIDTIK